jgi:hypothetical protein
MTVTADAWLAAPTYGCRGGGGGAPPSDSESESLSPGGGRRSRTGPGCAEFRVKLPRTGLVGAVSQAITVGSGDRHWQPRLPVPRAAALGPDPSHWQHLN